MKTTPNPKASDVPEVNLILDAGIKGQKSRTISLDTNRMDPVGGSALGALSLLMFPKSARCLWFECFTLTSAGLFVRSVLLAIPHPFVWVTTGLILLAGMLYVLSAIFNHPQCQMSALSKLVLFATGFLLSAMVVF